jgi:hypothetical protein
MDTVFSDKDLEATKSVDEKGNVELPGSQTN